MNEKDFLVVNNLKKYFRTRNGMLHAVDDVTFTIEKGKTLGVVGESGCGKSTLGKTVLRLHEPTSGDIILDGQNITNLGITERARLGISFAFQQPVRFKGITVKDLISLAAGKKLSTGEACEYLAEVGLCAKEYVGREVNASLSGGELKRID